MGFEDLVFRVIFSLGLRSMVRDLSWEATLPRTQDSGVWVVRRSRVWGLRISGLG